MKFFRCWLFRTSSAILWVATAMSEFFPHTIINWDEQQWLKLCSYLLEKQFSLGGRIVRFAYRSNTLVALEENCIGSYYLHTYSNIEYFFSMTFMRLSLPKNYKGAPCGHSLSQH